MRTLLGGVLDLRLSLDRDREKRLALTGDPLRRGGGLVDTRRNALICTSPRSGSGVAVWGHTKSDYSIMGTSEGKMMGAGMVAKML